MNLMEKFKKFKLFAFFTITAAVILGLLYYNYNSFTTLENGVYFPYLEIEICVDSEASKLLKNQNKANNLNKFKASSLDKSIKKCDKIINEVIDMVVAEYKNKFSAKAVDQKHLLFLKQKIQTDIKEKYLSIYIDEYKNRDQENIELVYDKKTKIALESKLNEGRNNFMRLVYALESAIEFEK